MNTPIPGDITERTQAEEALRERQIWLAGQREALEAAVNGEPLTTSLGILVRTAVTAVGQDVRAGFYLADDDRTALYHVVGMSEEYAAAVDGFKVGPDSLACGLATATGQPMLTADVQCDPLWQPWLWLAEKFDYRGCWSFPIRSPGGSFYGTLAIYSRQPREATERDQEVCALLAQTASIIISRNKESEARRRAEQALRESEERFRSMADAVPTLVWVSDITKGCTWFNKAWRDFTGRSMQELLGDGWAADVHPEDHDRCLEVYTTHFDAREPFSLEYRLKRRDGEYRWVVDEGNPRFGANHAFVGYIGACVDITERKQTELALRESHDQARRASAELQAIYDQSPVGMAQLDTELRFVRINEQLAAMNGIPAADHIGKTIHELLPDLTPKVEADFRRILETGEPVLDIELTGQTSADPGVEHTWLESWHPLRDPSGRVIGLNTVAQDITERKRAEQALRESEERFRMVADNIDQLAWTCDATFGNVTWYNNRWLEFTGLALEEMKGWDWSKVQHPVHLARVIKRVELSRDTGEPWEDTFPLRRADGHYRWFLSRAYPIRDEQGQIVRWFGTNTDITEQREAEEAERAARAEAERAGRIKDEFLATLSHELRTPLNAILGYATLMHMAKMGPEEIKESARTIERNARIQAQLIEDLLDMNRIISGRVKLEIKKLDLADVIDEAVKSVRPTANARGVLLGAAPDDEPVFIHGDFSRLQQVVWNLLSNAIKFTPHGGQVRVGLSLSASVAEIVVTDTGQGIPADFLPHVFERFRQVDGSTTRRHGGLGLGLSIVKHIVELHGGTVVAESPGEGEGATFRVGLPIGALDAAEHPRGPQPPHVSPCIVDGQVNLTGVRVLVVDDEPDATALVKRVLEECRATVQEAHTSEEALRWLEQHPVDVLVSDIGMPGEDGYQLLRKVRSLQGENREVSAVALTALARSDDRRRAALAGFQTHLSKPVDAGEIVAVVANLAGKTGRFAESGVA